MKKSIGSNDCKNMFTDRLNTLSMKELGIELKHFSVGTAPECPSFLVNQDELKKVLIDKFTNFFDPIRSQGLEIIFLKSNYGNGKSHFIRTIHSFLINYENVLTKKVSLKQEKIDLKTKILEGVGQKVIRDSASFLVNISAAESGFDEKEAILLTLTEKYDISSALAEVIFQAARSENMSKQLQAISILKGNFLNEYLRNFKLKQSDLNNDFYFNVIRLVCDYLSQNNCYLVIVFDEYEHIYTWTDIKARKFFFADIKLFFDHIETYKNLFFVFAESISVNEDAETLDDPAYVTRKKARTYYIDNISSENEVLKLYKMIKSRYEKYYEISLDIYEEEILNTINNDPQVISNSDYRNYTQVIMRVLDQYRNNPPKIRQNKKNNGSFTPDTLDKTNPYNVLEEKWSSSTSITRKTILCDALNYVLDRSDEVILEKSRKRGVFITIKEQDIIAYHIVATDNPGISDFTKRYNEALKNLTEFQISRNIMLYPFKKRSNEQFIKDDVIFYDGNNIPSAIEQIYTDTNEVNDVFDYLKLLEARD